MSFYPPPLRISPAYALTIFSDRFTFLDSRSSGDCGLIAFSISDRDKFAFIGRRRRADYFEKISFQRDDETIKRMVEGEEGERREKLSKR